MTDVKPPFRDPRNSNAGWLVALGVAALLVIGLTIWNYNDETPNRITTDQTETTPFQ